MSYKIALYWIGLIILIGLFCVFPIIGIIFFCTLMIVWVMQYNSFVKKIKKVEQIDTENNDVQ